MIVDITNVSKIFNDCQKKVIKACINTVNIQAAISRKNAIININQNFTVRNNWTIKNLQYTKCASSVKNINQIESEIGETTKAPYMERQEEGGTRKPSSGPRLAIPNTTARGGSNKNTVRKKFNLSTMGVIKGAISNKRANSTAKSRYVARAFVAARSGLLLSNKKTLFLISNFRKSGSNISFKQTPLYNVRFTQTQTPAKPWLKPAIIQPAKDGQQIFNSEMDKLFIGS